MTTKIIKKLKIAAATVFVLGLAINVYMTLNQPFNRVDAMLVAQTVSLPSWPPTEALKCRCHNNGMCYGGNYISFRKKCAEFPGGTGNCNEYNSNCPS